MHIRPFSLFYNIPLGQLLSRRRREMSTLNKWLLIYLPDKAYAPLLQLRPVEILRLFLIAQASDDAS